MVLYGAGRDEWSPGSASGRGDIEAPRRFADNPDGNAVGELYELADLIRKRNIDWWKKVPELPGLSRLALCRA